jgi:hypothetical protein
LIVDQGHQAQAHNFMIIHQYNPNAAHRSSFQGISN